MGSGAQYDVTGDGLIDMVADDPADARQRYGPFDGCVTSGLNVDSNCNPNSGSALFYSISGYDIARVPTVYPIGSEPASPYELRYTLYWTTAGLGAGSASDDPRQLGYNNPPDSTILTWNSWWRDYENVTGTPLLSGTTRQPVAGRRDIALTVGGSAKSADSKALYARSWRFVP